MKHVGAWQKAEFVYGRLVGGGQWSCCGVRDKFASCDESTRTTYEAALRSRDADDALRAARRAAAAERRRDWETSKVCEVPKAMIPFHDTPTLAQSDEEWDVEQSLCAALEAVEGRADDLVRAGLPDQLLRRVRGFSEANQNRGVKLLAALSSRAELGAAAAGVVLELLEGSTASSGDLLRVLAAATADGHEVRGLEEPVFSAIRTDGVDAVADRVDDAVIVLEAGFTVIEHVARTSDARARLRDAGAADLCLAALHALHDYMSRHKTETIASKALAAVVAAQCRVAVFDDGTLDPATVAGVATVYHTLRTQLADTNLQLKGMALLKLVAQSDDGAARLDGIKGAWEFLGAGCVNRRARKPHAWCCAELLPTENPRPSATRPGWTAPRLVTYLDLPSITTDRVHAALPDLVDLCLLPCQGERPDAWRSRLRGFEQRNGLVILSHVLDVPS